MAHYRAQISFQMDTEFPKDAVSINPHYEGTNPQALADALKTNLLAHSNIGAVQPFKIKVYDAAAPPPSYPLAEASNVAAARVSTMPREVALCLSFYSGFNRPRLRGRVYIPGNLIPGTPGLRPTGTQMTSVLSWVDALNVPAGSVGKWEVWSKIEKAGSYVTNAWCDDEWDTMRSRGLSPTTRQERVVTSP